MAFEDALATWLVEQRWFAGKGHGLRDLAIVANTRVVAGDPELRHLIVAVSQRHDGGLLPGAGRVPASTAATT